MRRILLSFTALLLILGTGCAGSREIALCQKDIYETRAEGDLAAALAEAEAHWALRSDPAELRLAIASWRRALSIAPAEPEPYEKLARAHYFLADGYLRFDEEAEDEMLMTYEKGTYYAELGLGAVDPTFRDRVCGGDEVEDVVPTLGKEAIATMYWYATNLGKWALAKGILVALGNKDKIFAMMTRIDELAPEHFYGAAARYFGAFYTTLPFPGGDPELSRANFDRSIAMEPNYFASYVLMAELLATKTDDRALFEKSLKYVLETPADIIPELTPENTAEKRKAEALYEEIDVYFDVE